MCATLALSRTHMNSACAPNLSPVLLKIRSPTANSLTAAWPSTTFPGLAPRFDIPGALNPPVQGVAAIDDRPVPPRLDELLHEQHILLHVSRWDQHQHLPVSEPRRPQRQDEVLQSVGGQVTAAPLQRAAAVLEREGAGCIEDDVVRLAVLGEVFLLVVDHLVGSDRSDDLEVFRAAHT